MSTPFDILIAGGGPVGLSLALALRHTPFRVGLIEARKPGQASSTHGRRYALSLTSRRILETLATWPADESVPIRHIHVSEHGSFGRMRLHSGDENLDAFGYVVDSRVLERVLLEMVDQSPIEQYTGAAVNQIVSRSDHVEVHRAGTDEVLRTRLLVGADGVQSTVRDLLGIATEQFDYGQTAIVADLDVEQPQAETAYERFAGHSAMAMLPGPGKRTTLIWTRLQAQGEALRVMPDAEYRAAAQAAFGHGLGRFEAVHPRIAFPLRMVRARSIVAPRCVLVGTAAQNVHPVGAQGLNLALRDVATFVERVAMVSDPGDESLLAAYAHDRKHDVRQTIRFTDFLARAFKVRVPGARLLRSAALTALDVLPGAKHVVTRMGLGLRGSPPAAALGIPPSV